MAFLSDQEARDPVASFVGAVEVLLRALELEDRRKLKPETLGAVHRVRDRLPAVQSDESNAIKERLLVGVYG